VITPTDAMTLSVKLLDAGKSLAPGGGYLTAGIPHFGQRDKLQDGAGDRGSTHRTAKEPNAHGRQRNDGCRFANSSDAKRADRVG
jgi:hypothetical protein